MKIKQSILAGDFDDSVRMNAFAAEFGNRYFAALDAYSQGRVPSKSWQVAFEATTVPELIIVQHLLLGINAHINLDLGISAGVIAPGNQLPSLERYSSRHSC